MQKLSILPISLYQFTASEELTAEVEDYAKSVSYDRNQYNKSMFAEFKVPNFIDWATECVNEVKRSEFGNVPWNLFINQAWTNRANMAELHHKHYHPNSFLSGIFYLTDLNKGGETKFYRKNPYWGLEDSGHFLLGATINNSEIIDTVKPVRGNLIVFPSSIWHTVNPVHSINEVRYTVAFNTFMTGELGSMGTLTYLNI